MENAINYWCIAASPAIKIARDEIIADHVRLLYTTVSRTMEDMKRKNRYPKS